MKYAGGCHCGRVRYEVEATINEVMECNCSICSKRGSLLAFAPEENFNLLQGEGDLTDYQFNRNIIHHLFCKNCGILSFSKGAMPDGTPMCAINVRCLDNLDIKALPVKFFDGKNL